MIEVEDILYAHETVRDANGLLYAGYRIRQDESGLWHWSAWYCRLGGEVSVVDLVEQGPCVSEDSAFIAVEDAYEAGFKGIPVKFQPWQLN